ncbi:MAG TPA: hypothetical protein VF757_09070 [Sphingomicrobium sp.]
MKASSATSARATAPRHTGQSSGRHPPTRTSAECFALSGPSDLPDPGHNAYRKDLADVALAGRVIASHYAQPVDRLVAVRAPLFAGPSQDSETIRELERGEPFALLDDSMGWAWGYAGKDRRVGYVRSEALAS